MLCYSSHGDESGVGVHSSTKCIEQERKALLRFKQGIDSDNCGLLSSWGDDRQDCCQWRGIRCSNHTGHVIMLHLQGSDPSFCLKGKLDPALFELKHLKSLDLSVNAFFQKIPNRIDSLTELEHLNLSNAGFYGEIPPQLGNLSKLASLDLSFYGGVTRPSFLPVTIKSLQWMSHLTLLREINLFGSNLGAATDWFQTINKIPSLSILHMDACSLPPISIQSSSSSLSYINSSTSLRVLSLSSNYFNTDTLFQWLFHLSRAGIQFEYLDLSYMKLTGPIPSPSFGKYMHSLSHLDLSHNELEGSLPNSFGNYMHSLTYLDLTYNSLSGPLPSSFGKYMRYLDLSNNKFNETVSKTVSFLCNLQTLDLANNDLADDMSLVIQALSTGCVNKPVLEYMDLSSNQFWGFIPDVINTFSSIKELHLNLNHLNGTISQGVGQLSKLEILDVSNNFLQATLTHNHLLNLSRLRELHLSDNLALVLEINDEWVPPFQLDIISLRSCKLGPSFPNWLLTQTNFSKLDISLAQISGVLPSTFWTKSLSPNLVSLNVSHNNIHGVLPNLSTSFDHLEEFDLSANCFEGSIPSIIGPLFLYLNDNMFSDATQLLCPMRSDSMVAVLDLSNNLLSGKLPNCLMKLGQLQYLHLDNNQFSGSIPESIGELQSLKYLHLQNNSFSGELPVSMLKCKSLVFLDVGYNSLTGYIPPSIGNAFTRLGFLNLRGNKLYGKLPLSLCQLSKLHMLDVAMNRISGTIPNCIYKLNAMKKESNELSEGDVNVNEMTTSGYMIAYYKVYNEFAAIEWKRESYRFKDIALGRVNYIDLSSNELEGEIPEGISDLIKLVSLDISRNKLTGSIPSNIGQITSLQFLDLSNNHLSGVIPASLAEVSFLGTLNLSNNNLSGRIPLSTQLQGVDASSYTGNPLLCGAPLQGCAGDEPPPAMRINNGTNQEEEEHGIDNFRVGLYISVILGFIIGFWGVCGTFVLKSSWRHAFFRFFDSIKDKIYVMVVVNVSTIWRKH